MSDFASKKQISFIRDLVGRVPNVDFLPPLEMLCLNDILADKPVGKGAASDLISDLLRHVPKAAPKAMAEPGYYKTAQDFLVVVRNRRGDRTYAKRLVVTKENNRSHAKWDYAPGLGYQVAGMTPMTLTEAAQFGHLHGICFVCCRPLTDPESVKRGIGPVCAKRFRR